MPCEKATLVELLWLFSYSFSTRQYWWQHGYPHSGLVWPATTTVNEKSVAVIPFVAMSDGPDDEFFADGLTEEILNALVNTGNLMVRWTNDRYLSTKHRVINTADVDRYSIPVFFGLIIVMPVLGHATWHLYRKVVSY